MCDVLSVDTCYQCPHLHDVAHGVSDGGALPLGGAGAGLLVDRVHHTVALLLPTTNGEMIE